MKPPEETEENEEAEPRNINGCPYNTKELINWIMKHLVVDFYYPFMIFIYFLFVASVVTISARVVSPYWYIIFSILFLVFGLLFIYRMIQRIIHKIENIGELNGDGWREFEFSEWCSDYPKLEAEDVKYRIGFVGDIMALNDYRLKFEERIKKFFGETDFIVGNLEGIILKDPTKKGGLAAQSHNTNILTQLERIYQESTPKEKRPKWIICVANNHSADFDIEGFKESLTLIENAENFIPIGEYNSPNYSWAKNSDKNEINIVAGTMWSNRKTQNLITKFKNCGQYHIPGIFNILYPHWHYENECYVRSKVQRKSINLQLLGSYKDRDWRVIFEILEKFTPNVILNKLLPKIPLIQRIMKHIPFVKRLKIPEIEINKQKWDFIFGHHPHVPQPITIYGEGILAYSGGNFTSSKKRKKHISGMILKCEIGQKNDSGPFLLGKIEWCYTLNERKKRKITRVESDGTKHKEKLKEVEVIIDCKRTRKNHFENRKIKFSRNVVIFSIALGVWLGYFWVYFGISFIFWILYALLMVFEIVYFMIKNVKLVRR